MPTYVSLIHFTQKGVESIKEGPARVDRAKQAFRAAGGELKAFYLVMGRYDAVAISEMPNDEAVARVALTNASMGNVRTETSRAFSEDEYRKIIASLPDRTPPIGLTHLPRLPHRLCDRIGYNGAGGSGANARTSAQLIHGDGRYDDTT
jgi:uncharacterized protein with GYD domain